MKPIVTPQNPPRIRIAGGRIAPKRRTTPPSLPPCQDCREPHLPSDYCAAAIRPTRQSLSRLIAGLVFLAWIGGIVCGLLWPWR